jgi:hypothetical protein
MLFQMKTIYSITETIYSSKGIETGLLIGRDTLYVTNELILIGWDSTSSILVRYYTANRLIRMDNAIILSCSKSIVKYSIF